MTRRKQKQAARRITWDDDPEFQRWIRFLFDRDDPKGEWRFGGSPMILLTDAQTVHYTHVSAPLPKQSSPPIPSSKSPMGFISSLIPAAYTPMHCVTARSRSN